MAREPLKLQPAGEPALRSGPCGERGRGVFAAAPIPEGVVVLRFAGAEVAETAVADYSRALRVSRTTFVLWSGGLDDLVNHSCDPNCGLRVVDAALCLTALRPIAVGTEITFDYSTSMCREPAWDGCRCGSPSCRGRVTVFAELPAAVRASYLARGIVPPFVLDAARGDVLRSVRRVQLRRRRGGLRRGPGGRSGNPRWGPAG